MARRHISRTLIGILVVTVGVGLIFYWRNASRSPAEEAVSSVPTATASAPPIVAKATPPSTPAATKPAPPSRPQIAMTITPSAPPAPAPMAGPVVPPPASRPLALSTGATSPPQPPVASLSGNPLTDAQAKKEAGDLLSARRILNDALLSGRLSPADTDAAKKSLADINQTVVLGTQRFAGDELGGTYSVQMGDRLSKIADQFEVTWPLLGRLNGLSDPKKLRAGQTLKIIRGPFNVVVTKGKFTMDIYLGPPGEKGSMYITTFPVGLGKDDSTPTGTWLVETGKKIKNPTYFSPRGEGVIDADDPKNPLGERWIGLSGIDGQAIGKSSYGIHGTIDESSIGQQSSMGCIRMHNADVELVFDLLVEGKSTVVVRD